jgi:ribokinase
MRADVVVVGSYNQDYVWRVDRAPEAGETLRGHDFHSAIGGKGFNQAVACARQGAATRFVGAIGRDAGGEAAQRTAAAEGIDACWLVRDDAATGSACILVEAGGQNRIVVALGANERLDAEFLHERAEAFAGARVLLAQLENNLDATRAALALAGAHGLVRLLNPAPVHAGLDAALLAACDLITPNETEFALLAERIAGARVDAATLAARDDAELHALARRLGVATVVVTLGEHGCFVSHEDARRRGDEAAHYRLAPERVRAVDATGAGDAFSGALAAALVRLDGRPFRAAALHANRSAAMSTEIVGTLPAMPRFEDVQRRFGAG